MTGRVILFAKAPTPGQVKTRLIPSLGAEAAAKLHEDLLERTLRTITAAHLGAPDLYCHPHGEHPFFLRCAARFPLSLQTQNGADLGERMLNAFRQALRVHEYAVIVGSDCPALQADDLREAMRHLQAGADAVLGPAEDGGYVLIGLRQPIAALFEGVTWGSAQVLAQTRQRLSALGLHWHELAQRWDLDRPEDVLRYQALIQQDTVS